MYSLGAYSLAGFIQCPGIIPLQAFLDAPSSGTGFDLQRMQVAVALAQAEMVPGTLIKNPLPYVASGWITLIGGLAIVSGVVKAIGPGICGFLFFVGWIYIDYF